MSVLYFRDDLPDRGAWNMAVDQALLEQVGATSQSVLRFYRWSPATLSLGYFQTLAEREVHAASRNLQVVRRASGGGAIVHDQELTYALVVPIQSRWAKAHRELYDLVHMSIIEILERQGVRAELFVPASPTMEKSNPMLCFQRRAEGDLLIAGNKVGGSAQRRSRSALLQHGSILLRQSAFAPELPGIKELCNLDLDDRHLAEALKTLIAKKMGMDLQPWECPATFQDRVAQIENERFGAGAWTKNR